MRPGMRPGGLKRGILATLSPEIETARQLSDALGAKRSTVAVALHAMREAGLVRCVNTETPWRVGRPCLRYRRAEAAQ